MIDSAGKMSDGKRESPSLASEAQSRFFFFFLLQSLVSGVRCSGCFRPVIVQHGSANLSESNVSFFPVDAVLEYRCDPGYLTDGPSILTCTSLGLWSSEPPNCIHSDVCQPPYQPESGGYVCHPSPCQTLSHGTVIEYLCDDGFSLRGERKYLTCEYGEWDSQLRVTCLAEQGCMTPYMVQNSWVNLTANTMGRFPAGTVLQYSCDPGYLPNGPSLISCTSSGRWSSEPPRCVRSDACLPMTEPENGGYTCHPSPCQTFSHGTVLKFFCDPGFVLKGEYKYLTCQNGQWDGPVEISCVSQGCSRPYTQQHVSSNLTEINSSYFLVGTVLEFHCEVGFIQEGSGIITCLVPGHWSSEPPRCLHSDVCLPPYQPDNGGFLCHPFPCGRLTHGTVVEYFCDEGYILRGDYKYLTCQYGEWDSRTPVSCLVEEDDGSALPLGMPALSIVSSTASSVALVLLLVVLFVLLQPKLKSLHRREPGLPGAPVSIMVEGVQVCLPSYEEAVCGGDAANASPESRVQIVLSEGLAVAPEPGPSRPSALKRSEGDAVHGAAPALSSSPTPSSSTWDPRGAAGPPLLDGSPTGSEALMDSEMDYADDMPLLKEA